MSLNAVLTWYQNKIGTYDKESWERNVEKCILKGFSSVPKKTAKIKTDFIDVDLVRGTTFPKAKPQHGMLVVARKAFVRTLLLPFYLSWWQQQTTKRFSCLLLMLYILQFSVVFVYFTQFSNKDAEEITYTEILGPLVMMIVLGVIHSQVVSTYNPMASTISRNENIRRKRTKRRRQSKGFCKSVTTRRTCRVADNTGMLTVDHNLKICNKNQFDFSPTSGRHCTSFKEHNFEGKSKHLMAESELTKDSTVSLNKAFRDLLSQIDNCDCNEEYGKLCNKNMPSPTVRFESALLGSAGSRVSDCQERNPFSTKDCCNEVVPHDTEDQTSDEARHDSAVQDVSSMELETDQLHSDTEMEASRTLGVKQVSLMKSDGKTFALRRRMPQSLHCGMKQACNQSCNSSCESEADTTSPNTPIKEHASSLDMEWGMTTNTDGDQSYESDTSEGTEGPTQCHDNPFCWDCNGAASSTVLNPSCTSSDKGSRSFQVSCTIWEGSECKKADLCVLDISSAIIRKVALMPESTDYFTCGIFLTFMMSLLPAIFRAREMACDLLSDVTSDVLDLTLPSHNDIDRVRSLFTVTFLGSSLSTTYVMLAVILERFFLCLVFFFLLSVAERTFKQRFLYAKLFSHLTSSRRSRRSELPYFRLNKVRNIKTWLSVRSYLKKHGPQRSVDVIVSAAFVIALLLISFLCVQILKENEHFDDCLYNWEVLAWSFALGIYLLRFMTLGAKINKKYRNLSILLTEQINLYVQMEQKPQKKEGLVLANNVLKLASQLLKELESPFKISGLSANPYLYNITKLVILSAFSAVLTELLGFKLKLYKIKIK